LKPGQGRARSSSYNARAALLISSVAFEPWKTMLPKFMAVEWHPVYETRNPFGYSRVQLRFSEHSNDQSYAWPMPAALVDFWPARLRLIKGPEV
jgi:hypothetical protein